MDDEEEHDRVQLVRNSDGGSKEGVRGEKEDDDELEGVELILFHVKECYVYLVLPQYLALRP